MSGEEKLASEKRRIAELEMLKRAANRLNPMSERLVVDAEQLRDDLAAYSEDEVQSGSQEDVFLRSIPIWKQKNRPCKDEYVHMLSELVEDGHVVFYHRGKDITPRRKFCGESVPYLLPTEDGFRSFIGEVDLAIASNVEIPGFVMTGDGIEKLFSNHQNMLHTASMVSNWSERAPVHIDYDLAEFRALDYDSREKVSFSPFTSSVAEQAWHMKMMLEHSYRHGRKLESDTEGHRRAYWRTVRDFPIGTLQDLAMLQDAARFELRDYKGLLKGVIDSLTSVVMHLPR